MKASETPENLNRAFLRSRTTTNPYLVAHRCGLGDCGLAHYWTINEAAAGNPLALTLERSKTACDGVDIGPENWPEIWRPQMTADEREER